jgi:adenine-specific DNA-methyltransferase
LDGVLVRGENYLALRALQPQFQGKVAAIYIDPPFNKGGPAGTRKASGKGGDGDFAYSVNYQAAPWVTLLANRLEVAREFLSPAGSIVVRCSVDGNMYVRMLLDEVFGAENFRNEIAVRRAEASKGEFVKQFDAMRSMTVNYDNLYWYSNDPAMRVPVITRPAPPEQRPARWHSFWKAQHRPHLRYELLGVTPPKGQWMWKEIRALAAAGNYKQYLAESAETGESLEDYWRRTGECLEFVKNDGRGVGAIKYWIPPREIVIADSNWLDVKGYANTWRFKTENSEALLQRVIAGTTAPGDRVMDFFLGSGTTVAVAHKLGRRWVGVEVGPHFETTILPRLKEVLAGRGTHEPCEISKDIGWQGGGFFQYCTLGTFEDAVLTLSLADLEDK